MLSNIGIRFSREDYSRWRSAVNRVISIARLEARELPMKHATNYYQDVYKNIVSQKYASDWNAFPYHQRYAEWKEAVAETMDFWRLFGSLLSNLKAFKVQGDHKDETAWMGGIDDSAMAHGKKIAMYGTAVETGYFGAGRDIKPRPVFRPTALEYEQKRFREYGYKSLDDIKNAWR